MNSLSTCKIIGSLLVCIFSLLSASCGGDFPETKLPTTDEVETFTSPQVSWSYDPNLKTPVTDLAACIETVTNCVQNENLLKNCFSEQNAICTKTEPQDGCCTQQCADQVLQLLEDGKSEQKAFLEVFVYDGSCMPNVTKSDYLVK